MTSSKPYLLRALYQWILDNDKTPHVLIDTTGSKVEIPPGVGEDGTAVLNLAPRAVQNFEMTNEYLSFSARFNGVAGNIFCPVESIMGIYARETGTGMMFPAEADDGDGDKSDREKKPKSPTLKVIK